MAETSSIEWTDATWNPVTGCSVVSPGCTNCYAMRLAGTRLAHHPSRAGLTRDTKAGPVWTGEVRVNWEWIDQPLTWSRPRRIFVCAHGDLFHEEVGEEDLSLIYGTMIAAHHLRGHQFQVLTKRSARARELLNKAEFWAAAMATASAEIMDRTDPHNRRRDDARATCGEYGPKAPPPGIWLGVSAEDQTRADERVPDLLATPAAVRFISAEPLLGPIDLRQWLHSYGCGCGWGGDTPLDYCRHCGWRGQADGEIGVARCLECREMVEDYNACPECEGHDGDGLSFGPNSRRGPDWVIVGGESGNDARPMHPDWARGIRDQCEAAGVPFFFKQWGEWGPPRDSLGRVDWPYHPDYDRTHWFDARTCVRPIEPGWDDKYHSGLSRSLNPFVDLFRTPEFLGQVARCSQASCVTAGQCQGNEARAAVTRYGKRRTGRLLDGRTHDAMPAAGRAAP